MNKLLEEKIAGLPENPGVYIMRDSRGGIIYIGKAVVLKNRVRQYFFNTQKQPKVQAMVDNIADFDYIITLSERDALALEANLIKKYKPHYNILLKDDKAFPYIRINTKEDFPAIEITRRVRRDGARYFGPYFNGILVKDVIDIVRSAYRLRSCMGNLSRKGRECLNYHINLCLAPCSGKVTKEEYAAAVAGAIAFLSGYDDAPAKVIERKMNEAAAAEDFERAIFYRDRLEMLRKMKERTLADLGGAFDIDAFAYVTNGIDSAVSVTLVRGGKLMGVKNYMFTDAALSEVDALNAFLLQYYGSLGNEVPGEICLPVETDTDAIADYLGTMSGIRTKITFPSRSARKKLLETARRNAADYLEKNVDKARRAYDSTEGANELLKRILRLDFLVRMECYDISNISGTDKVASQVVFRHGAASKADYRRFRIKTVEGSDDFASMAEVIRRRCERYLSGDDKFNEKPDLIVIDGGKGQLSAAYASMRACGLDIPMIGLAKREEEIYTVFDPEPIVLPRDNSALKLLQRIRDEAHRFAITYHRNLRSKRYGSELENIPGIGPKKRAMLLKKFSVKQLKEMTEGELVSAGLDKKTAANVRSYFNRNKKTID